MKRVGIALSGGGIRGIAHIGILKVLCEEEIPIECISGTSMGGMIGALYARDRSINEIEAAALRLAKPRELFKLLSPTSPRRGLLDEAHVRAYLSPFFAQTPTFAELSLPLGLLAVDLIHPQEVYLKEGNLLDSVMATCAVPGVFKPVEMGPWRLVDGGIMNNLPVCMLPEMGAEVTFAVDVQIDPFVTLPWQDLSVRPHLAFPIPDSFLDFYRSELIMVNQLMHIRMAENPPDILIRPEIPMEITMFTGYQKMAGIIAAGEKAAREALPDIRKYL
jgi:NTE family protein